MILQSIEIENFRCFRHSRFENFGQVNLIGGKNNAGKTALLEALLLVNMPTSESVIFLQQMRSENSYIFKDRPELAWGNFFLNQDKKTVIKLSGQYDKGPFSLVEMTCSEQPKSTENNNGSKQGNSELVKVIDSATLAEVGISTLTIKFPDREDKTELKYIWEHDFAVTTSHRPDYVNRIKKTFLIPTGFKKSADSIAREFEKAKLQNDTASTLEAFRIIDDTIEKIDSINIGEPRIYIFRKGEKPQSLNFFGDALNKVADVILRVVNNPNCTLLIDEIENGIYHDNQEKFWKLLIKLAVLKNVQVFATTHSAEMIEAFQAAAVADKQEDKVRYIAMFKSARTGEIVGAQRDMENLGYNLRTENPYRGE